MRHDDEQLFEFERDLDERGQDHDERPVLVAADDLPGERLHDFGRLQEAMKFLQDQDRRAVGRRRRTQPPNRRKRILYVFFQLVEVAVTRNLFAAILDRIAQLAIPPPVLVGGMPD